MEGYINDRQQVQELLQDWIISTERMVGARMKKFKVQISDTTKQNIRIELVNAANTELHFYYRNSLRFLDMGARPGYRRGVPISNRKPKKSTRIKKPILNKVIYPRLAQLQGIVAGQIIEKLMTATTPL